jgi:hypothetical protein
MVGTMKVVLGQAGGGTAGPVGTLVRFSIATAIMATSVALIPVTDGIRVRIIYQLVQRRSRPDDGGSGTLLYRVRQFETASSLLGEAADLTPADALDNFLVDVVRPTSSVSTQDINRA